MAERNVLVVEDDAAIRRGILDALRFHGYGVLDSPDGETGLRKALEAACDLVLLDLVLPGKPGLEVLREIRRKRPALPVIILTALGQEDDRVKGLQLGADDYVVKPFSVKELLARIESVLRRSPERPAVLKEIKVPGGCAYPERREVRFDDGGRSELSDLEMSLLEYLASNSGRAISREELLQRVWRVNPRGIETRTIDMHVARLREKLRDDPAAPRVLRTVRGKGYLFVAAEGGA